MRYYFAYGSNMSPVQMQDRCPGAKALGPGILSGWQFRITTRGTANIVPCSRGIVHGVIWKCGSSHIGALDKFEGVHRRNYLHKNVFVYDTTNKALRTALTYVSLTRHYTGVGRVDYLRTAVIPGAMAFGLPQVYISELESWLPVREIGTGRSRYRGVKRN
jgi:gamma-glutamylcyclotransferase (GGCT)/AIG2-like uncharacterized protein YtfP